ncbi:JNK1/MAPK8-associated membrane protein-like [Teleopsis dalmanni]|uniref:JNK1/MAPK8-associated membrane protein-like n=1 Tax=Teleopsis dalmanni TaxID=139649 RepID=UPI0018CFED29|nr:JNK1/MAPK8-associated membrane protein-like [Teleopsis dalmanni]
MYTSLERCPGTYCGRTLLDNNGTWSECGSCARGSRVNEYFACAECQDELPLYSWLYLGFMTMLPFMLHCFFIDLDAKDRKFSRKQLTLTACALFEVIISALLSVLVMEPQWEFRLHSCHVRKFNDWYTLFYNPNPNYQQRLYCTQEAVYPLQTIVLVFYFMCLVTMFMIRPIIVSIMKIRGRTPIYSALYFLPLLTFIHALGGGLIYFSFPYLSIAIAMISNAIHYSLKLDQSYKALIRSSFELKNLVIIASHWILLAYGIVSLGHHTALLAFVPFPSVFYILTVRCTDPAEFREVENRVN